MPVLNNLAQAALKPFPKRIRPSTHAMLDYINVGMSLVTAGLFWRRNRRASVGCLICGGAMLGVNLLTDYPGGAKKVITYRRHRDIDFGIAALTAIMPEFLAFKSERESRYFVVNGVVLSAITELTQFPPERGRSEKKAA